MGIATVHAVAHTMIKLGHVRVHGLIFHTSLRARWHARRAFFEIDVLLIHISA